MTSGPPVSTTQIPGLLVFTIPVHDDDRGWFKETWNRERMVAAGLPDFGPVQQNVSFNTRRGATRGIHTEPWDKLVSVASGRVFGAWVDMRSGPTFGTVVTMEIGPDRAVFVPRGVGNSYQTLEDATSYSYLVNDHWRAGAPYPALDLADPALAIDWPIPLSECEISEKDRHHNPVLADVAPIGPRSTLVIGATGQVGSAMMALFGQAEGLTREDADLQDLASLDSVDWRRYDVVVNGAAYTAVDAAEEPEGRRACWQLNAHLPARLAALSIEYGFTLVHLSSDYVFDGVRQTHPEDETFAPLGVYGQAKAAGDLAVATAPRHYVLRTSWVVGDGANFVRTMAQLAERGVSPTVVDDQIGRLSFADELAASAKHLIDSEAPFGTYNVSNSGAPTSWAELAAEIFRLVGRDPLDVVKVSTEEYGTGKRLAPRPRNSTLELDRLIGTGRTPQDQMTALARYLA